MALAARIGRWSARHRRVAILGAAGLPLLLGLSAVAISLGLLAPISQVLPVDQAISSVIVLIGLGVGVDYSMFYIRRERDERAAGAGPDAALLTAAATSGRAVLISGTTVMIAMAGMYVTGNATFQSFATGTMLVVAVAMIEDMARHAAAGEIPVGVERLPLSRIEEAWERQAHGPHYKIALVP